MADAVIAVDLGGTKLAAGLVRGAQVLERRELPTHPSAGAEAWLDAIADLAQPWCGQAGAVGVAVSGVVPGDRWHALNPAVLPVPPGLPLRAALERRLGLPIQLANDAQAAAWGEWQFGAGQGSRDMAFVTVSTGIGGGLILEGRPRAGPGGIAGSLGHVLADPAGPSCGCGRRGCLEAVASGSAMARAAGRSAREVFEAAGRGEPWADDLIEGSATALARALADLKALVDVELVVIGGGVGLAPGYLARVRRAMALIPPPFRIPLGGAKLGADAGLIGAADLAQSAMGAPSEA